MTTFASGATNGRFSLFSMTNAFRENDKTKRILVQPHDCKILMISDASSLPLLQA